MLLSAGNSWTASFGEGLLSRMPLSEREKRIVLANNIAGQLMFEGRYSAALAQLQGAKNKAESLLRERPALYATLLLNLASASNAGGQHDDAARFTEQAAETLDQQFVTPANSVTSRKANAGDSIDGQILSIAELLISRASSDTVRFTFSNNDAGHRHIFTLLYPVEESEPI